MMDDAKGTANARVGQQYVDRLELRHRCRDLTSALEAATSALKWASGSADFGTGGKARRGWLKIGHPAIEAGDKALAN